MYQGGVSLRGPNTKRQSVLVGVSSHRVNKRHDNSPKFSAGVVGAGVAELVRDAVCQCRRITQKHTAAKN